MTESTQSSGGSSSELLGTSLVSHQFRPGESIGRYVLLDQVGQGGMGVVFAAFDPQLNRKIALKILQARVRGGGDEKALRTRLYREAQAIARLSHPHVITVFDVGTVGASVFVAMEFVEGSTLTQWLDTRRGLEVVLEMFGQAGRGLSAAHQAGLVHRDFKPDNVLVGQDGMARVSDFGLARSDPSLVVDEDEDNFEDEDAFSPLSNVQDADLLSSPMTQTGAVVGTPRFMAPEQHAGAPADARSDQFAFCVALYQACYGEDPYVAHTMERLVMAKQNGRIREPPSEVRIPSRIEQLIWKGLSPDPLRRYPSMAALLEDLQDTQPSRSRPLLRWVGALGASATVLGIAATQNLADAEPACVARIDPWRSIWSSERKAALQSAFERHGADSGTEAWARTAEGVDGYIERWNAGRRDACQAFRVRHEQSETVMTLRLECLEQERHAVDALLDVFGDADAAIVQAGAQAVAELPDVDRCSNVPLVLATTSAPMSEAKVADLKRVRGRLVSQRARLAAGHVPEAVALARDAVRDAEAVNLHTVVSEARLALGTALERAGEYAEAEAVLSAVVWEATRSGHDEIAAAAAVGLVSVSGDRLGHHADGERWEEHARALLDRVGLEGILRARLENNSGNLDYRRHRLDDAAAHYRSALQLRRQARGDRDPGLAGWTVNLGNVQLARRDFEQATKTLEEAKRLAHDTLPATHPTSATVLATLGVVHLEREQYEAALEALEPALASFTAALGKDHPWVATTTLNIGHAYEGTGDLDKAAAAFTAVASLYGATAEDDAPGRTAALLSAAGAHRARGDVPAARAFLEDACSIGRVAVAVDDLTAASCLRERASLDLLAGELEEAAVGFDAAIERYDRIDGREPRDHARALMGFAGVRLAQERRDEALDLLAEAEICLQPLLGVRPKLLSEIAGLRREVKTKAVAPVPAE